MHCEDYRRLVESPPQLWPIPMAPPAVPWLSPPPRPAAPKPQPSVKPRIVDAFWGVVGFACVAALHYVPMDALLLTILVAGILSLLYFVGQTRARLDLRGARRGL